MSTYSPTVTVAAQPYIEVYSEQDGYNFLQNTIAATPYKLITWYQMAQFLSQVEAPMTLVNYLANGDTRQIPCFNPPAPDQVLAIVTTDFSDINFVFNGQGAFWQDVNALEQINGVFGLKEFVVSTMLPGESNIDELSKSLTDSDFFKDYVTSL